MEVLYPHCAGLDCTRACPRESGGYGRGLRSAHGERFGTARGAQLQDDNQGAARAVGLAGEGCTHVAMEATGVYWKPVWHVLSDGDFTLVLANAAHVKNVPGRKTDMPPGSPICWRTV